jgi:hypothetical protein
MNHIENTFSIVMVQQYLDRFMRIRCQWNLFTEQLPSNSPDIVDDFTGRYQATAVVSMITLRSLPSSGSVRHSI